MCLVNCCVVNQTSNKFSGRGQARSSIFGQVKGITGQNWPFIDARLSHSTSWSISTLSHYHTLGGLKTELLAYLARVSDLDTEFNPLEWWKQNAPVLLRWSSAVRKILLVQLSSAAAECVFSSLKVSFGEQQNSSLQDYMEASLVLQFHKR